MLTKGEMKPIGREEDSKEIQAEATVIEKTAEKATGKTEKAKERASEDKKKTADKRTVKGGRKARRAARLSAKEKKRPEKSLSLEGRVTVGELAARLNVMASEVLSKLLDLGLSYTLISS